MIMVSRQLIAAQIKEICLILPPARGMLVGRTANTGHADVIPTVIKFYPLR